MIKKLIYKILLATLFLILSFSYYATYLGEESVDKVFLTLSTFLFALLSGFFISRQATRYSELRKLTAEFDGNMSSIYRTFTHFSSDSQKNIGAIITKHYELILSGGWDYPLKNKTTTITDLHIETQRTVDKEGTEGIRGACSTRLMLVLSDLQKIRKGMVSLRDERIPTFQWLLIYLLTAILILVVSTIDSYNMLLGSLVKAAFIFAIFSVVVLLRKLDNLQLFSGNIGENSARDVIEIIKGVK